MNPLALSGEAHCSLNEALDFLVSAFLSRGFNVYSKLDIQCHAPVALKPPPPIKCVLLRSLYPRSDMPSRLCHTRIGTLIRCSAVIKEMSSERVWIELSKPTRSLNRADPEARRLAFEADRELRAIMGEMVQIAFPARTAETRPA